MKRLLPALALLLLAFPVGAGAKEVVAISVCGTNGCHSTRDKSELSAAIDVQPQAAPDQGGAFLRLRTTIAEPGLKQEFVQRSQWIPSLHLIRNDEGTLVEYSLPYPATVRMLQRLSKGLQPFPASKLGPVGGASQSARVSEVVAAPPAGGSGGGGNSGGDGDGSGWAWSLLAIAPAGIAFWLYRRRRTGPSPA
jgi:hypothetical protein